MIARDTFEKSLADPLLFWSTAGKQQVRDLLGEDTACMVQYSQNNPHHCYDLFLHCLHTVQAIPADAPVTLRVAAFFHDIGKPCVAQEKQGRLVFYGHAQKSAEIARGILLKLGYLLSETELICFYIRHHDDFISWVLPTEEYDHENPHLIEITAENVRTHIGKGTMRKEYPTDTDPLEVWTNLLMLCYADASAQAKAVYQDGILVDTKKHKLEKVASILNNLHAIYTADDPA